jgi:hypothetical protein
VLTVFKKDELGARGLLGGTPKGPAVVTGSWPLLHEQVYEDSGQRLATLIR